MDSHTQGSRETDVLIVGAGPVGLSLARLLGLKGHRVTVIDRKEKPYPLPRGVVFDDEIGRVFQNMGLTEQVREISAAVPDHYQWQNRDGEVLVDIDWSGTGPSGWPVESFFCQPELEKVLADGAAVLDTVEVLRGVELEDLAEDGDGVTATCRSGAEHVSIRAQYMIGSDGARSTVRRLLGIGMTDLGFEFDWLIVDTIPKDDLVWSPQNWQLCDPRRPTTLVSGGKGRRRWEFMRLPHETPAELSTEERAWELLADWGRTPENSELERFALYRFTAGWAEQWNRGRVALAGDAAHQMPPFAGQGMCSGIRDAANLSWKLDLALTGQAGPEILDSYTSERSQHIRYAIGMSVALGKVICVLDEEEAAARDERMLALGGDPAQVLPATEPPVLGPGILDPRPRSEAVRGTMAPQFPVDAGLFDEVVGDGPVLLTRTPLPRAPERAFALSDLGDPTGAWSSWLDQLGADAVLIRPDHYLFGIAPADQAEALLEDYHCRTRAGVEDAPATV